uniref:NADH-ubiquinone oxidoreductase chain 6 n=1 Tax=Cicadettana calliope TaxID=2219946 RepID=A0A3Q8GPE8_9HEMI|nr:NADH dehydrogenase subunit 6 [Cicadettana calliope]
MKIIMFLMIILSINFIFMKHPLSMGLILLMQTILSCLTCSFYLSSYLFSYILYLIFIGGMLILFMYMSSIASNEKFFYSTKLMTLNFFFFILMNFNTIDMKMMNSSKNILMYKSHSNFMMMKMYIIPSGMMNLIITIYLLFVLIVVINILTMNMLTLRSSN